MFGKTKLTIKISGMSCQHCANAVKAALEKLTDVSKVEVDLSKNQAMIIAKKNVSNVSLKEINKAVHDAGYNIIEEEIQP